VKDPGRRLRENLVDLRNAREDRAIRAVARLRRDCEDTEIRLARERRQLDDWRFQADEEEAALYAALLGEPVGGRQIERVLAKVDALRQRTRSLERAVEAARQARDQARLALQRGQAACAQAARATRKSVEVLNIYRRDADIGRDRSAEEALDEIAVMLHGRNAI
jgi:hypothetical protein